MKKNVFLLGIVAMALASCSHSEYDGPDKAGGKLMVTGTVEQIMTRAGDNGWDTNDKVGVSSDANTNVLYVTENGDGTFASSTPIYVLGEGEKTFTAYYPYHETVTSESSVINFDTPLDFMWASAKATRENPVALFKFEHKMSKMKFTISNGSEEIPQTKAEETADTNVKSTIKIEGVPVGGSFNTLTGEVTPSSKTGSVILDFEFGKPVEFILPSTEELGTVTVLLTLGDKTYSGTIDIDALSSGTQYNYTIDIKEQGQELSISSTSISDWTKEEGGEIKVEETQAPKEENKLEVGDFLLKNGTVIDKNDSDFDKTQVAGVVFYVGNPQPSALYGYNSAIDVLKADYPGCTNGLAIAINDANDGTPARFASAKYSYADVFKETAANYDADLVAQYISTNMNLTAAGERMLGYNNTKFVQACAQKFGDDSSSTGVADFLALLQAYNTANAVANASTWYMPSFAELNAVVENYDIVKASVEKAGGTLPSFSEFGETNTQTFYWSSDFRGNSYNWVSPMMTVADGVNLYLGRNSNGTQGFFRLTTAF